MPISSNDTQIVLSSFRVYGSIYLGTLVVYTIVRQVYPRLFNIRSWSDKTEEYKKDGRVYEQTPSRSSDEDGEKNLAVTEARKYGLISWLWKVFQVTDDQFMEHCGMDATCFLRALSFGRRLTVMGCFNALWLIPCYATAKDSSETSYLTDPFVISSLSNLPSESRRFLGTVIASYLFYFYAMYLILYEFKWYTHYRHLFLSKRIARNYTVYISGIPPAYQSSQKLARYFAQGGAVEEAHLTVQTPKLDSLVCRRNATIQKWEHAVALERATGKRRMQMKVERSGMARVESMQRFQKEYEYLTREIQRRQQELEGIISHDSGKNLLHTIKTDVSSEEFEVVEAVRKTLRPQVISSGSGLNQEEEDAIEAIERELDKHTKLSDSSRKRMRDSLVKSLAEGLAQRSRAAGSTIMHTSNIVGSSIAKNSRVAAAHTNKIIQTTADSGVVLAHNMVQSAGAVVPLLLTKSEGEPTDAGFVVFSSLYATQMTLQMLHHPSPGAMVAISPGDPLDIFWRNVGLPQQAKRHGVLAAMMATTVLCFFWSVPISLISSLTELNSLKLQLPKLARWLEDKRGVEKIMALFAPLLLLFINESILPSLLKFFAMWEGHISSSMLEASLFLKLGCFMIIQTFFVSVISGGILAELTNILAAPNTLIDLLANSLPAQSSYFIQVVLAQTFLLQSIEILRVYPLFVAFIRRFAGPRATARERQRTWGWFNSLDDPPDFWHAETFAQLILLYMVAFVYSPIAPVTSFFLFFCFVLLESGYRYQYIHNYPRSFETGGQLWKFFIRFTLASMLIGQITLMGLLALKQSPYAGPALGPLLAVTILFVLYINSSHDVVSEHLPTRECHRVDLEHSVDGPMPMDFCIDSYVQPALQPQVNEPKFEDDVDETDDVEENREPKMETVSTGKQSDEALVLSKT